MAFWLDSSGKLIVDASGLPIDCPFCPCGGTGGGSLFTDCCPNGLPTNLPVTLHVFGPGCESFAGNYVAVWNASYAHGIVVASCQPPATGAWVYSGTVAGHSFGIVVVFVCNCPGTSPAPNHVWAYLICDGSKGALVGVDEDCALSYTTPPMTTGCCPGSLSATFG